MRARFLLGVGGAFSWTGMLSWLVAASWGGRGRLVGSAIASAIAGVVLGPALGGMAAQYSGVLSVLVPLRFDHLGATGLVIGAAFVVAGIVEAVTTRFLRWLLRPARQDAADQGRVVGLSSNRRADAPS